MSPRATPRWTFLTNYAQVLMCIAHDPGIRVREIGELVGITERAAHRIVAELVSAGYITRQRDGRRNSYEINTELSLPDQIARERNIGDFLDVLVGAPPGAEARWLLASRRRRSDD